MALSADHWCFGHRSWGNVFLRTTVWSIMRIRNFSYLKTPCPKSTCIARHRAFFVFEMPVGTLQQHEYREASRVTQFLTTRLYAQTRPLFPAKHGTSVWSSRESGESKARTRLHPQSAVKHTGSSWRPLGPSSPLRP